MVGYIVHPHVEQAERPIRNVFEESLFELPLHTNRVLRLSAQAW